MADPHMPAEGESFLQELVDSTWHMAIAASKRWEPGREVVKDDADATYRQAKAEQDMRDYIKRLYAAVRVRR